MNLPHLHLLLNHWPIIGAFIGLGLFIVALIVKSDDLKKATFVLFTILALVVIPVYLSGNAAERAIFEMPEIENSRVRSHEGAALLAFLGLELTGLFSIIGLWQFGKKKTGPPPSSWAVPAVLVFSIVTAGLMAVAGNTGGDIRHPEIIAANAPESAMGAMGMSLIKGIEFFVIEYSRWIWPMVEDFHFIGLILLLATAGMLDLRMLGFFKKLPLSALQRFIPLGIAGLAINIITGFMFFIGMPYFYVYNVVFHAKIVAVVLAGANLLLFHWSPAFGAWEHIGPGEDAPPFAKLVAVSSLLLWFAVIIIGRYIPLGEV